MIAEMKANLSEWLDVNIALAILCALVFALTHTSLKDQIDYTPNTETRIIHIAPNLTR
jgi:capsular polysaccharide biosynthesis protein